MTVLVQGPVVQSFVSLTSSLRAQLVKCFTTLYTNTLKWEKLALHIFSTKKFGIFQILTFEMLTSRY